MELSSPHCTADIPYYVTGKSIGAGVGGSVAGVVVITAVALLVIWYVAGRPLSVTHKNVLIGSNVCLLGGRDNRKREMLQS